MLFSASSARTIAILTAAALQAGCAVPLGPGFGHPTRAIDAGIPPAALTGVHLRVTDTLKNSGNRDLVYLDVDLPEATVPGSLKIAVDGRDVQPSRATSESGAARRVSFDHRWVPGQSRTIVIDYTLPPEFSSRGLIAAAPDGFCVADPSAFPAWLTPPGLFASSDWRARTRTIEVTFPAEFRVLAGGLERHTVRQGTSTRYQFRTGAHGTSQYVVAGRYLEQRVKTANGEVVFWTFQPLDASAAQAAAERLAATSATFGRLFGALTKHPAPMYVVESPAPASSGAANDGLSAASFPEGVLLDRSAFARGLDSEPVLEAAEYGLARIWFGWYGEPNQESRILLGRGISLFAVALAAEARGGEAARRSQIARLYAAYQGSISRAGDQPLVNVPVDATLEQLSTDAYRAALFWAALEDLAGPDNFGRAMRRYWTATKDQPLEMDELRSALEAAAGRDFAPAFRTWLNRPGVPDDFRARYSAQP